MMSSTGVIFCVGGVAARRRMPAETMPTGDEVNDAWTNYKQDNLSSVPRPTTDRPARRKHHSFLANDPPFAFVNAPEEFFHSDPDEIFVKIVPERNFAQFIADAFSDGFHSSFRRLFSLSECDKVGENGPWGRKNEKTMSRLRMFYLDAAEWENFRIFQKIVT